MVICGAPGPEDMRQRNVMVSSVIKQWLSLFIFARPCRYTKSAKLLIKNMKWQRYISHSLKVTGLILLSANLCNWEAEKLFE